MLEFSDKTETKLGSDRSFGIVFGLIFAVIALSPIYNGNDLREWALGISAVFLTIAILHPTLLRRLNLLWFRFGMLLNKIVSPIVMGLVFVLTVIPTGLVIRLRNRDPLRQKLNPDAPSYWIDIDEESRSRSSMRNQF